MPDSRNTRAVEDQFCNACGVSVDLHPSEDPNHYDPEECGVAARKADLIHQFWGQR